MAKKKNFIDPEIFREIFTEIETVNGEQYQDIVTVYGDMSRLVVSWLANMPPAQLQALYTNYGWGGNANVLAIHEAARRWFAINHPDKLS